MHRVTASIVPLAIVIALVAWLVLRRNAPEELPRSVSPAADEKPEPERSEEPVESPAALVARDDEPAGPGEPRAAFEPAAPTSIVLGSVADEYGEPLVGARVRLYGDQVWTAGVDVPRLDGPRLDGPRLDSPGDRRGFEVETDDIGLFRFEVPVPTDLRTVLEITPGRSHESYVVYFDDRRSNDLPGLAAGVRDLGEIRLATTGALRGRVVDEAGMPIADAKVTGCFQIPGMERGTYRLTVRTQRDAPLMEPMS